MTRIHERQAVLLVIFGFAAIVGVAFLVSESADAATTNIVVTSEIGISGETITNPTSATALTVPSAATSAWIMVKDNPVCWGADASDPTATSGGEWPAGFVTKIDKDRDHLLDIKVINCAEGATTVKVYYTRSRRRTE